MHKYGDPNTPLRTTCEIIDPLSEQAKEIAEYLLATCGPESGLIGLAAPQIGFAVRMIVLHVQPTRSRPRLKKSDPVVMINPVWNQIECRTSSDWEGCGSLPGIVAKVSRYERIEVKYFDIQGSQQTCILEGLEARIVQHECDHLNGVNFLQRADLTSVVTGENYLIYHSKE